MKKYAMVDTEKSTRIFISAFTWFLRRTVPSSRNAKPACIARTRIAPSRMNRTSDDVLRPSMFLPPFVFLWGRFCPATSGNARCLDPLLGGNLRRSHLRRSLGPRLGGRVLEEGSGAPLAEVVEEEAFHGLDLLGIQLAV